MQSIMSGFTLLLILAVSTCVSGKNAIYSRAATATTINASVVTPSSLTTIVAADTARLNSARAGLGPLGLNEGNYFVIEASIGSPSVYYTLLVDTGSSNTWIGAIKPCPTGQNVYATDQQVYVAYGSGNNYMLGNEILAEFKLSESLVVYNQSMGCATETQGLPNDIDGILGLGPLDMTQGTLHPNYGDTIPTVPDGLYGQGRIYPEVVHTSIELVDFNVTNAVIQFGGEIEGETAWANFSTNYNAARYWGYDLTKASYGDAVIMQATSGIVDTGTTYLYLPSDAFELYANKTGATYNESTGLLTISPEKVCSLKSLYFWIEGEVMEITPATQILPWTQNESEGVSPTEIILAVASTGAPTGQGNGVDVILGYYANMNYCVSLDTTNSRIGFTKNAISDSILSTWIPGCLL